ncbi:ribosomal protein S18 acetylase RimI-like enzyme [Anaerosolibacter carboniphilus]|uniref:Ribosomal protein S18 acetylase RimI-like enzyme n=1 Tax=Anaerosolibacter carboniphilus TaxID=1417629 RepID=A0A841L4G9_9FIRM|nr:ribosomal protein S18 acetylase RimI-like enzyme [Anaerosolibacter carboniphilus]
MKKEEILSKLVENRIQNINLINFIEDYPIHSIEKADNSFLVRGRSDQDWVYFSSNSPTEFEALVEKVDEEDEYFAIIEDWMLPYLLKDKKVIWELVCMKLYFPEDKPVGPPKSEIVDLTHDYVQYIFDHSKYKDFTSVEYITERIEKGIGLGILRDEKLVAWLITHDDGAMGFLHVLDEYRGRGYALDLTVEMVDRLRKQEKIPFVHIEENNVQSMGLALKMGFKEDRRIRWLKRGE